MQRTNIQRLACALERVNRASKGEGLRPMWADMAESDLDRIVATLPSGSGFDAGCTIDDTRFKPDRIVIMTSFHHMNEDGYYCGWSNWRVVICPTFDGITVNVRERATRFRTAPRRMVDGMADYIGEVFHNWALET